MNVVGDDCRAILSTDFLSLWMTVIPPASQLGLICTTKSVVICRVALISPHKDLWTKIGYSVLKNKIVVGGQK